MRWQMQEMRQRVRQESNEQGPLHGSQRPAQMTVLSLFPFRTRLLSRSLIYLSRASLDDLLRR